MGIDIMGQVVSYGIGGVDEVLEWWDGSSETPRTKPFQNARDIGRLVLNLGGLALQVWMPRQARLGDTVAKSSGPLLVKSVVKALKKPAAAPAPASHEMTYVPRASSHKVTRTYEPEFKTVVAY